MKKLLLTTMLCMASGAMAADGLQFKFSGFGTAGVAATDNDGAQFRSSLRQTKGAEKSADPGVDSRLGVQGDLQFNETFSAVGQLLASRREGSDRPVVEWLYAQAKATSWLDLKVGRMVLPAFLVSDSRNVGYASHWVRPPIEVYGQYPHTSFDGGQVRVHGEWAGTNYALQVSRGKSEATIYQNGFSLGLNLRQLTSVNLVAEHGDWTLRFGRTMARDVELTGVPFPPDDDNFTGLGLQYDNGQVLVMAEYVTRRQPGGVADSNSYYVTGGYRFGPWMPYATYGHFTPKGPFYGSSQNSATKAVGLRWDAFKNVAIKAQFESTDSGLAFVNQTPAFAAERPKVNVLSLVADFVF